MERVVVRFFIDNNVPDSVGRFLESAGHEVTRLREVMLADASDPVIEYACSRSGQVLVTHDTDFRATAKRLGLTQRQYRSKLHRIQLRCAEPLSARRIEAALSLIEHEWLQITPDRPMEIEIRDELIRILR